MQQFRPDIKPPQWGPMPDVQFAVKVNAERMGIDPAAFVQYLPVWERGGVWLQDVFRNPDYVVGTDVANYRWSAYGLERTAGFLGPSVGLVKPAIVGGLFTIIQQIIPSATAGRWYLSSRSDLGFQIQFNTLRVISTIRASSANVITSSINHAINQPILAAMSWDGTTFSGYSDGRLDGTTTPVSPLDLQSGQMSLLGNDYNSGSAGSVGAYLHVKQILTQPQIQRLYYEPYTLLMPVARPLYFDLGSVGPGTEVEGPFAITHSASLGIQGIKGVVNPAIFTHTCAVSFGGVKNVLAPVTITHTNTFGVAGVKEEFGLGAGPLTITHASSIGIGGIKGARGPVTITHATLFGVAGIVGVLMPELSNAVGVGTGPRSAAGNVTTNKANGTLYAILTLSDSKPSVAQIQAGQNHLGNAALFAVNQPVTTAGEQSVVCSSGLTPLTTIYWHFQHKDDVAQESSVITSGSFSTQDIPIALSFSNTAPAKLQYVLVTSDMGITAAEIESLWGLT